MTALPRVLPIFTSSQRGWSWVWGAPPCSSPAVRIVRPPHGRSPLLLIAQLLLLASQLFPLPLDSLLFPSPLLLYVHPFPLQPLPLQTLSVQALPLEFQPFPLPLKPLSLIPLMNDCEALLPVSPLSLSNFKEIFGFNWDSSVQALLLLCFGWGFIF